MRIYSWNVNGLRAVYQKGFLEWLAGCGGDVVCLQEIKAQKEQLPWDLTKPTGYRSFFSSAVKKGYSGVAIYVQKKPISVKKKVGLKRFDDEGRVLILEYPEFTLFNFYIPHGDRSKKNLAYKLEVYRYLLSYLKAHQDEKIVLAGDFNIAHTELDLARPQENQNNIMFTSEERGMLDQLIDLGFIDSLRQFIGENGYYTWWPYTHQAYQRNIGWRLDYGFVSGKLKNKLKRATIHSKIRLSDHCPISLEVDL